MIGVCGGWSVERGCFGVCTRETKLNTHKTNSIIITPPRPQHQHRTNSAHACAPRPPPRRRHRRFRRHFHPPHRSHQQPQRKRRKHKQRSAPGVGGGRRGHGLGRRGCLFLRGELSEGDARVGGGAAAGGGGGGVIVGGGLVWGLGVETCRSSGGVGDERKSKRVQFEPRCVLMS